MGSFISKPPGGLVLKKKHLRGEGGDQQQTRSRSTSSDNEDKNNSHNVTTDVNSNNALAFVQSKWEKEEFLLKWDLKSSEVRQDYVVLSIDSTIDRKETILIEKCSILKYKTPFFRASASVLVPALPDGVCIQLGWVQAIKDMVFINQYGDDGITSWEFPELSLGKCRMISDSDGHLYPWYGNKKELIHITGPTASPTPVSVFMNDSFSPQVTWHVPVTTYGKEARLTKVFRNQSFVTCLVVLQTVTKTCETRVSLLKAITWNMRVDINVQPKLPVGQRASIGSSNRFIAQPVVEDVDNWNLDLEDRALHPPNANKCQILVWRPTKSRDRDNRSLSSSSSSPSSPSEPTIIHNGLPDSFDKKSYFEATGRLNGVYEAIS